MAVGAAAAADLKIVLSSAAVLPGETLRVEVDNVSPYAHLRAELLGKTYPFFEVGPAAQRALIGIPLSQSPGEFSLKVRSAKGTPSPIVEESVDLIVSSRTFEVENIDLPSGKNVLMKAEHQESRRIHSIALHLSSEQLWEGTFEKPVHGPVIANFGLRRTRNHTIDAGFHKGVDLRAQAGTFVLASNTGVVALAASLKAHGRTVMINHGQGIMTIFLHMQTLLVKPGQRIAKGAVIGKVGSSGLSTAPHVHWQVFVHGVPVDPIAWTETEF